MNAELRLETERLILRPWQDKDAEDLYTFARDPRVGPAAGWPPHTCVEDSLEVIRAVFAPTGALAVVLKTTGQAIGSIGLMRGNLSNIGLPDVEAELGYWIGVPYWGMGLMPEAAKALIRYGFCSLGLEAIWCGSFDSNEQSRRVQEKCGFHYHHTAETWWQGEKRIEHFTRLTRKEYEEML